ncbi:DNA replication and repair protein RecF [bacterium]|nr:DNA replication and repair protein RecF [bacterium]
MTNSYEIKRLVLTNFRSYDKLKIDCEGMKNIIITGENGAGKTNILEAVSMLSISGPFRKAKLSQLGKIESDNKIFTISAQLLTSDENHTLGISYNYKNKDEIIDDFEEVVEKRLIVANENNIQAQDLQNFIKIIWITPFMDRLFSEATSERRKFLDNLISNFYPFYGTSLNQYNNLLKQRSKILKGKSKDLNWLSSIEEEIVSLGVSIADLRLEFEEKLNKILSERKTNFPHIKITITGLIEDKLRTNKAVEVEDFFKQTLIANRELFKYNFSPPVEGIHRSDFTAYNIDKNISADQTSTGEQKCTVISIILAYANLLYLYFDKYPIILIDEAPAHLDNLKLQRLFEELENIPTQVWFTGIIKDDFEFFDDKKSLFIHIENSKIK